MRLIKMMTFTAVLLLSAAALSAQGKKFAVKFSGVDIRTDLNTPVFTDRIDKKSGVTPKKWALIMAEYHVKFADIKVPKDSLDDGKWLDEVEVKWEFLHKKEGVEAIEKLGRFSRTVKYSGIGEGKHRICLFVNPVNLKRYFKGGAALKNVWLRLSMKVNGYKEKDATTILIAGKKPEANKVARYQELFNTDRTKPMKNILMRRDESPFRSIQFDLFDTMIVGDDDDRSLSSR